MGKVLEQGPITICVWPNDHEPPHCHVFYNNSEYRVYFEGWVFEHEAGKKLNMPILRRIREVIINGKREIGREWRRFHGN
ncbi:MAG: DUF4160 domain-containing protein [Oligoflexales bacterium]|nr:DUF4160 domain-containing protein [Oligoflexales bacterium]